MSLCAGRVFSPNDHFKLKKSINIRPSIEYVYNTCQIASYVCHEISICVGALKSHLQLSDFASVFFCVFVVLGERGVGGSLFQKRPCQSKTINIWVHTEYMFYVYVLGIKY